MTAEPAGRAGPQSAADAFDLLYERHARGLARQALLLCGHRRVAEQAVTHGFHQVWQHWPEVAVDRDPAGWVRGAVYTYALSPWHLFRPGHREPEAHPGPPYDRALLEALLSLPRSYRATLLLHDGVGLSLPDTAAETESSTPAAAGRLTHAREELAGRLPRLAAAPPERRGEVLAEWLRDLAAAQPVRTPPASYVRAGSESSTRLWTRAAVGLAALVAAATGLTVATWDGGRNDPAPRPPDAAVTSPQPDRPDDNRPGRSGSGSLSGASSPRQATLQDTGPAYLPQLRSTNRRMHWDDFTPSGDLRPEEKAAWAWADY